jgi:hypothetical protein
MTKITLKSPASYTIGTKIIRAGAETEVTAKELAEIEKDKLVELAKDGEEITPPGSPGPRPDNTADIEGDLGDDQRAIDPHDKNPEATLADTAIASAPQAHPEVDTEVAPTPKSQPRVKIGKGHENPVPDNVPRKPGDKPEPPNMDPPGTEGAVSL